MRAVQVHEWTTYDQLKLETVPDPKPGPKQLRIEVEACGVSFATSLVVQGKYQRKPPRPFAPGTEVSGHVVEVGDEVTRFKVGDRVCCILDWGGWAEQAIGYEVNTYPIPDEMPFERAVALTTSYSTSAAALIWPHLLNVKEGDWLLVHGAAGGVGLAGVEIGKALGATVIATAGGPEKVEFVKQHGADHAIDYRATSFREPVLELTGGRGVDAVLDPVGGDVFDLSLRCMAPEARISPVGFASGRIPDIPANILLVKNLSVVGLNIGTYYGWSPKDIRYESEPRIRALMDQLFSWYSEGKLHPNVSHRFKLEQFQDALRTVLERKAMGKVVMLMNGSAKAL